jgi:hypothetical protein
LAVVEGLPGDIDLNGMVDDSDVAILSGAFGSTPASSRWFGGADLSHDGVINTQDILVIGAHYLETTGYGCQAQQEEATRAGPQDATSVDSRQASFYQALDDVGLLGVYLDYLATHPDAGP